MCAIQPTFSLAWYPVFALLLLFGSAPAQNPDVQFETISLDHGLSQSIVNIIHRDSRGFMWFGTESGLNRYDGYNFTVYKHHPFDTTSISSNEILSIHEDRKGVLWVGVNGGLNRFDPETETFIHYRNVPGDPESLSHDRVRGIYEDYLNHFWVASDNGGLHLMDRELGTFRYFRHDPDDPNSLSDNAITGGWDDSLTGFWVGTRNGLNRFDPADMTFKPYLYDPDDQHTISHNDIISIYSAPSEPGILWISTGDRSTTDEGGGLNRFDVSSGVFTHFRHKPGDPASISSDFTMTILEGMDRGLWVGSARGLNRLDRSTGKFEHWLPDPDDPKSGSNFIRTVVEDISGDLWITTLARDGIYRFDVAEKRYYHYTHDIRNPYSLSHDQVQTLYEDSTGVLWIGTMTGGLSKVNHYARKFRKYVHDPSDRNSLSNNLVRSFVVDRNRELWVGVGSGGLNRYSSDRTSVIHYLNDPSDSRSLSNNFIWALCEDRAGTLWAGTVGGGLNRFDRATGTFSRYSHQSGKEKSLSSNFIRAIYADRNNTLWIGTEDGLNRFNPGPKSFTVFRNDPDDPSSISANVIRAITEGKDGALWVGTFGGGLCKLLQAPAQKNTANFIRYQHDPRDPTSLSNNAIQSIYVDKQGILWIGTFEGGLNRFDPETEKFTSFTEQNSNIPNNVVYGVLGDESGRIWCSTNLGLFRYDPSSGTFMTFDVYDGLQSREFNGQACFRSADGEMFFGGIAGFNSFFPDSVIQNPFPPRISLTGFRLFNEYVPIATDSPLKKHISAVKTIELAHWQNNMTFEFVALHFNRSEGNLYEYKLEHYDEEWQRAGTRRAATYTNLYPGEYIFRVRASNSDGIWDEEGVSVRISISPPWWKTVWAYALYVLAAALVLFVFVRFQKMRVEKRERGRSRIREAELRAQAAEAQARAVQAENERQTHEFEKARNLQLSMLPKKLPNVPNLDIAVHMQTAAEVGGDYYDFYVDEQGNLTVVIGDATGHGLNAGTMVSVVKSLFVAKAPQTDMQSFFSECTKTIKQLHLGNLFMGLSLMRIENDELTVSAAGMPPMYIFRKDTESVEEIVLKGMPLGAFEGYRYQDRRVKLAAGDTILLLSDGLPELFNESMEMFDYPRVKETFGNIGSGTPEEIIENLVQVGNEWRNGLTPNDDVTFVVLKVKGSNGLE